MSSAEDTSAVTVTPSANAGSSPEESVPMVQAESISPLPATPPDEPTEGAAPASVTKPLPKGSAIAHEVRVRVTGARPGGDGGERDLFSETTTTVLVFEKGGVIRLTAAVAPGQLLFLTNEESQKEVVTQVTRKRAYRPTECYVELEFTESAPQFWGVDFSAETTLLPKGEKEIEAAELVASSETSTDDPGDATPAPNPEEVSTLKKEVEALRGQLKLLQKANTPEADEPAEEPKPAPKLELAETWEPAPVPLGVSVPPTEEDRPAPEAPVPEPLPPAAIPAPRVPIAASEEPLKAPFFSKSLPLEHDALPKELAAAKELAPARPLQFDFSRSLPQTKKASFRARGNFTPGFRSGMLRVTLLTLALVGTVFGAAWYKHWLPWKPAPKRIEVASWAGTTTTPATVDRAQPTGKVASPVVAETHGRTGKASNLAPAASKADPPLSITVHENLPEPDVAKEPPVETPATRESPARADRGEFRPSRSSGKRLPARTTVETPALPSIPPDDGTTVPPTLIRSAKALASLDELRDFETGAVIIEAVVDTSGDVISMNVVSGPPSLRKPAMDALKNYKYEPATRNGKPVPARVSVRIQFHFE